MSPITWSNALLPVSGGGDDNGDSDEIKRIKAKAARYAAKLRGAIPPPKPGLVDIREQRIAGALDKRAAAVVQRRPEIVWGMQGIPQPGEQEGQAKEELAAGGFFPRVWQLGKQALRPFSEPPADTTLGQLWQMGRMTIGVVGAAFAPFQAAIEHGAAPAQVIGELMARQTETSPEELALMPPEQRQAFLQRLEENKPIVNAIKRDIKEKGFLQTYLDNNSPEERAVFEGIVTALVPVVGFTNLPQGSTVKVAQAIDQMAKQGLQVAKPVVRQLGELATSQVGTARIPGKPPAILTKVEPDMKSLAEIARRYDDPEAFRQAWLTESMKGDYESSGIGTPTRRIKSDFEVLGAKLYEGNTTFDLMSKDFKMLVGKGKKSKQVTIPEFRELNPKYKNATDQEINSLVEEYSNKATERIRASWTDFWNKAREPSQPLPGQAAMPEAAAKAQPALASAKAELAKVQAEQKAFQAKVKAMSDKEYRPQRKALDKEDKRLMEAIDEAEGAIVDAETAILPKAGEVAKQPWDITTEQHFQKWLDNTIFGDERSAVESGIKKFVGDHPDVLTRGDSWSDIRKLAERRGDIPPYSAAKQAAKVEAPKPGGIAQRYEAEQQANLEAFRRQEQAMAEAAAAREQGAFWDNMNPGEKRSIIREANLPSAIESGKWFQLTPSEKTAVQDAMKAKVEAPKVTPEAPKPTAAAAPPKPPVKAEELQGLTVDQLAKEAENRANAARQSIDAIVRQAQTDQETIRQAQEAAKRPFPTGRGTTEPGAIERAEPYRQYQGPAVGEQPKGPGAFGSERPISTSSRFQTGREAPPSYGETVPPSQRPPAETVFGATTGERPPRGSTTFQQGPEAPPRTATPPPERGGPPTGGEPPDYSFGSTTPPSDNPLERTEAALRQKKEPFAERLKKGWGKFLIHWSDRNDPTTALSRETNIPVHTVMQLVPGATGAGEDNLRRFVEPVLKRVAKDADNLQTYMTLQRDLDLLNRYTGAKLPGKLVGHPDVMRALTQLRNKIGPERYQAIQDAANELWKAHDRFSIQRRLDAGMLTPEAAEALRRTHPHYIPFHRQGFDELEDWAGKFTRPEGSISDVGIKRMELEGSTRDLDEPLYRLMADFIHTERLVARNEAAATLVKGLKEMETARGVTPGSLIDVAQPNAQYTISFFENGKKVTMALKDEVGIFAEVAKNMDAEASNLFTKVGRFTAAPLAKGAVTYNPMFIPTNVIRDALTAFFREKLIPFGPNTWRAMASVIKKDANFSDAAQSKVFLSGIVDTLRTADAITRAKAIGGIQVRSAKDALLVIPRLIERANLVGEQTTRLAVYNKLRAQGVDKLEAAVRARDATVDFAKAGTAMQAVNAVIPFSNAGVQGGINTLRTFKHKPLWAVTAAGMFATPTIISRVNNMRYPDTSPLIPHYEYANNWVLQVGEFTNREGEKQPIYIKIPKGQIAAQLSFPAEAMFNYAAKTDDRTVIGTLLESGKGALTSLSPVEPTISGITPPLPSTMTGIAFNKNLFTGQSIIPRREEQLLPEQQFGPETSKQAIALGKQFKISPRLIQFAIDDYTAGAGQTVSWMTSMALEALGYKPEPFGTAVAKAPSEGIEAMARVPVVKRFVGTKGTQIERQGWDKFVDVTEDTNRDFARISMMNNLGVKLGSVSGNIGRLELTPQERAEYQRAYAAIAIPATSRLVRNRRFQQLTADQQKLVLKKEMDEMRAAARFQTLKKILSQRTKTNAMGVPPSPIQLPPIQLPPPVWQVPAGVR